MNHNGTANFGFEEIRGEGISYRLSMPEELAGKLTAEFFAKGPHISGAKGDPRRIASGLGIDSFIAPRQVHGVAIAEGRPLWTMPARPIADGIHLDRSFDPDCLVTGTLRYADCTPVLIASYRPRPWAMLLHSGFQGTRRNIFAVAWRRAEQFYGPMQPETVHVWIGPAVGPCCYTRLASDPAAALALASWGENALLEGKTVRFDIAGEILSQANKVRIPRENIRRFSSCTACNNEIFCSYRAGDREDRMLLKVRLADMPQTRRKR